MVIKMNEKKMVLFLTMIATIAIVVFPTIFQIYQRHEERLYEVALKELLERAEACYRDQVCKKHEMTIRELNQTNYSVANIVNPKTKTYFDESLILVEEQFQVKLK